MNKVSFFLYIFSLLFAPLAFGTVEHWSLTVLECVVVGGCLLFLLSACFFKDDTVRIVGLLPLMLLLLFMMLQLVPLPQSIVKLISPASYDIYAPVLQMMDNGGQWVSLSVNRRETLQELLRILSYVCMYIMTVQLLSHPDRLKKTVNIVVFCAAIIAFFAIIQKMSSPEKIFWLRSGPRNSKPFGPWINPNQFAGYIEMVVFWAVALFLFYRPRVRGNETFREKFVGFFTVPGVHFHLFLGYATVLMVLAVFISLCRGGILSLILGGSCFLFLFHCKFPRKGRFTIFTIIMASLVAVSWFGWESILREFGYGFDSQGRLSDGRLFLWEDVLKIIKDFPLLGAGFGSFMAIYPLYKTIGGDFIYDHAHNDYLELFSDGGIIGFSITACFVLVVLWHGWKMIRVRRDQYAILLGIGSISGLVAMLGHSITDFNMHNGAVGLYFFLLCGVLVASVNCRFNYYSPGSLLERQPKLLDKALCCGVVCALIGVLVVQGGSYKGAYHYGKIKNIYVNRQLSTVKLRTIVSQMRRAIAADPFEGLYSYKLATSLWYLGEKNSAVQEYILAAYKDPLSGIFLQQIGMLAEDEEKGKSLIEEGYKRALDKDSLTMSYVDWLLLKNRKQEALSLLRSWFKNNYKYMDSWMPLLKAHSFTRRDMVFILPENVDSWLTYGKYCESIGSLKETDYFYSGAMVFLPFEKKINPAWFTRVISYYNRSGNEDKVLDYIRMAVEVVPGYPLFHIMLGDRYRKNGISYRAKEEYERVLVLDPGNKEARSKLRKMGFEDSY